MLTRVCFFIAAAAFVLSIAFFIMAALRPYKQRHRIKTFYVLLFGVFTTATALFIPFYAPNFQGITNGFVDGFLTLIAALHTTIRLFLVDCDFRFILEETSGLTGAFRGGYIFLLGLQFVIAPAFTIGVILSFFANLWSHIRFAWGFRKDAYIFSELNDRSIALAKSLRRNNRRRVIVFTDVFEQDDETSFELLEQAKEVDAICFKKDITVINFRFHSKKAKLYFFIMGENDIENVNQAIALGSPYVPKSKDDRLHGYDYKAKDIRVYLFSDKFSSEQHMSAMNPKYIKLRRINNVQSLVYNILYENGAEIFDSAKETGEKILNTATGTYDNEKKISALIIGMGLHGTEMTKALSWFCQMHPYRLEINVFDKNKDVSQYLRSHCPDLFDWNPVDEPLPAHGRPHNGDFDTPGESHYKISVYPRRDASRYAFDEELKKITDTTYVFVALGDDDTNIKVATKIRILFRRLGVEPIIHTIVYNSKNEEMLRRGCTASGESYNLVPFGDTLSTFTEKCILQSDLEEEALARHMQYAKHFVSGKEMPENEKRRILSEEEEKFWKFDYNYRSSVASVLHTKFKRHCKIPGSDKKPNERTEDEKWFYRILEHKRWNAYVRSEGYVYAPVRDKLAKTHHLLIPFDQLPYEEQIKDDD